MLSHRLIALLHLCLLIGLFCRPALAESSKTLIRNAALILTMDPAVGSGELGIIENGDVLLLGDRIVQVGKNLRGGGAQVVDATGKIVMPGFVDVHNHLWQSLIRGCGTNQDLIGWLNACVFPLSNPVIAPSEAETYAGVRLSTLDLISAGVTTVVDWSHAFTPGFVRGNIRALQDSGLRFAFAHFGINDPVIIENMKMVKRTLIDPNPRATFQVASHPAPVLRADLIAMAALARELNVKFHVHLLENIAQREDHVFSLLQEANALGPSLLGAHAIHLTSNEIKLLAQNDVRLVHNPLSNMRLASGVMLLPKLKKAGIQVGLGLDGGTNDTTDMFNNMRAALGLQRAKSLDPSGFPTVADVLRMATVDGARLLDMFDRIGSLTPGKKADLIIIDPATINFAPRFDWISQIVFNGQPSNVLWVFVDGRPLKRRGKLIKVHSPPILRNAEKAAERIRHDLGL